MDATDPEKRETAASLTAAKDWQPEDSTASSSPFLVEQNGSESLASSKDEEGEDQLSECQDSQSPLSSPASQPQLSPASKETLQKTSQDEVKQVRGSSAILTLPEIIEVHVTHSYKQFTAALRFTFLNVDE